MITYYDIHGLVRLKLDDNGRGRQLRSFLSHLEQSNVFGKCVELTLCRNESDIPELSETNISGRYKGISWRMTFSRNNEGQVSKIYFWVSLFVTFLAVRIVLIPLVKTLLIEKGGFSILGSMFKYQDAMFQLFGRPGTGKTKLTMQAVQRGAELVGDCELLVFHDGGIQPLFDKIEFRYATVRHTPFWRHLNPKQRRRLWFCHFVSFATARHISFNISVSPNEIGCGIGDDTPGSKRIIVYLDPGATWSRIARDELVQRMVDYSRNYESIFGNAFAADLAEQNNRLERNIRAYLQNCVLWKAPIRPNINDVLALSKLK